MCKWLTQLHTESAVVNLLPVKKKVSLKGSNMMLTGKCRNGHENKYYKKCKISTKRTETNMQVSTASTNEARWIKHDERVTSPCVPPRLLRAISRSVVTSPRAIVATMTSRLPHAFVIS